MICLLEIQVRHVKLLLSAAVDRDLITMLLDIKCRLLCGGMRGCLHSTTSSRSAA